MHETAEDMQQIQGLLNSSVERAGTFLRQSFEMPEHSLSARQLVHFWQKVQTIALATVTRNGEPRVAPIGALLLRGQFYIPTVMTAARTPHILRQPAVSFTFCQGNEVAIIAHGHATIIQSEDSDFAAIEAFQREATGASAQGWGEGIFLHIQPATLFTYARDVGRLAEG